jgi:hypothetical protein
MVADSNKNNVPSPGNDEIAGDRPSLPQPELSISRRVKIGSVLLLMLCGYFFMEDGPRSGATVESDARTASIDLQMQQFIDELEFVDSGQSQVEVDDLIPSNPQPPQNESQFGDNPPLQLPAPLNENSMTALTTDPALNHGRHHSPRTATRPTLRFTGRIEPLR